VCKNPKNPGFNHYLFESVAALIKQTTAADPAMIAMFEEMLFPAFELVLQQDVQVRACLAAVLGQCELPCPLLHALPVMLLGLGCCCPAFSWLALPACG
jgi:hypothetical protein